MTTKVNNVANASHAAGSAHASGFSTATRVASYTLNGKTLEERRLSPEASNAAKKLTTSTMPVEVKSFHMNPADVKTALSTAQGSRMLLHDVLVGADDNGRKYFEKFSPQHERLSTKEISSAQAFDTLQDPIRTAHAVGKDDVKKLSGADLQKAQHTASGVDANYRTALSSLLQGTDKGFKLYQAHWDNQDDTERDGIVALNATTGEVRAMVVINPP